MPAYTLPPLLPRYRRPFSVSSVLDDTIQVFRQAWLRMIGLNFLIVVLGMLVLGIAVGAFLVAGGITLMIFFADVIQSLAAAGAAASAGRLAAPPALPAALPRMPEAALATAVVAGAAAILVSALFGVAWYGATALITDRVLRGQRVGVWQAFAGGLRRAPALIGAGILFLLGLLVAAAAAFAIVYILRAWTLLAALVALVGLIVWAVNKNARRTWLKWLIVLATPFGLPFYLSVAWSLYIPAGAVEGAGPIRALQRSAEFVTGCWFRIWAMWLLMSIIVSLLEAIPGAIVGAAFVGAGGANLNTAQGINLAVNVARIAGNYLGGIVFAALPMSAGTLAFVALRNQREGTDLADRLAALELPLVNTTFASPATPTILH